MAVDAALPLPLPGLAVRAATAGDLPFLRALYHQSRAEEVAAVAWPEQAILDFLDSQFALQHRHYLTFYGNGEFLLVERDGVPVGRLYLHQEGRELAIVDILLEYTQRGSGIGTALLAFAQQRAMALRCRSLRLSVLRDNHGAQRLYQRLGYVEDAEAHDELRIAMRLQLS